MSEYKFVKETSNLRKIKIFFLLISVLLILAFLWIIFWEHMSKVMMGSFIYKEVLPLVGNEVKNFTLLGIFYVNFIGSLFFIPLPNEIIYFTGLLKGNKIVTSLFVAMGGIVPAHLINYFIGNRLSKFFVNLISKKKLYKTRRTVNKYGPLGVFAFNFLPLPSPLLTFVLGLIKYNKNRLFTFIIMGNLLKLSLIGGAYYFFFSTR